METEYLLCYQKEGRKPDVTGAFEGFHVSEDCESCFLWFLQPGSLSSSKVRRTRCSSPWSESISRLTTASPRAPWKNLPRQGRTGSDGHHNHKTAYMMRLPVVEGDVPTLALHPSYFSHAFQRERSANLVFSQVCRVENSCDQLPVMPARHFACEKSTKNFLFFFRCS